MIKALNRLRLKRRGLMSEKSRRKHSKHEWLNKISDCLTLGAISYICFAFILGSLIFGVNVDRGGVLSDWGAVFLAEVTLIAGVIHFYINHPRSFSRNGRVVLIFGLMFIHLMMISLVFSFVEGDIFGERGERYLSLIHI